MGEGGGLSRVLQYSNFVTSMRHIIIIIVLLFQTRVESSRAVLEVGVGRKESKDCRVELEVELRRRLVSLWAMWHPHAPPAGKRCGEWLIKS